MRHGRAETTVGIPRHQDPSTSYPDEFDEDAWTEEFLSVEDAEADPDGPIHRANKGVRNRRRFL